MDRQTRGAAPPASSAAEPNKLGLKSLPEVLTVSEAAGVLRIGRNSAYEAIRRGDLPAVRIGRRLLVPKRALSEFLAVRTPRENEYTGRTVP